MIKVFTTNTDNNKYAEEQFKTHKEELLKQGLVTNKHIKLLWIFEDNRKWDDIEYERIN